MRPAASPSSQERSIARRARELFIEAIDPCAQELAELIWQRLSDSADNTRVLEMRQTLQDMQRSFGQTRTAWVDAVRRNWREALGQVGATNLDGGSGDPEGALGLVDDAVIEQRLLILRLTNAIQDKALWEINALRIRIRHLEHLPELADNDVFQPKTYPRALMDAWVACELTRPAWALVQDSLHQPLAARMTAAYHHVNEYLIEQRVLPQIDLKGLVRRSSDIDTDSGALGSHSGADASVPRSLPQGRSGPGGDGGSAQAGGFQSAGVRAGPLQYRLPPGDGGQRMGSRLAARAREFGRRAFAGGPGSANDTQNIPRVHPSVLARAEQETRMLTGATPLVRMRERAQGVLGQLRRLLTDRGAGYDAGAQPIPVSPALANALAPTSFVPTQLAAKPAADAIDMTMPASLEAAARQLRRRATDLKTRTDRPNEKAIIEIVALMFQAILAEERIPAALRVWFARLQIPVLRLALAEPDFFASADHPARQLIDRMGGCAMGFDAQAIAGTKLGREIKRIVQVIEQYPETGRRVFQLVLEEFKKFLGRSLTERDATRQAVTLAQQVEQRDALAIQYTIELRKMLASVSVSSGVQDFLFHIWCEVLAMATVRLGAQHETTLAYKKAAADLLWAISPKPDRTDRGNVVQQLPQLLQALREGMATVGIVEAEQDRFIKQINDAVMQAFVSRGEGIALEKLEELGRSLAHLENIVTDDAAGDVMLDPDTLELMFSVDASSMNVIATGGSDPGQAMLSWAAELELGAWFTLEFMSATAQVQYVWRSARGQLHLFASAGGMIYLVQTTRLAAYLQAGLLTPLEDETLTARATRDALARLQAAPDALVN